MEVTFMNRDTLKQIIVDQKDIYLNTDSKCLLITNSEEATLDCNGIQIDVVPVWKWLLVSPTT